MIARFAPGVEIPLHPSSAAWRCSAAVFRTHQQQSAMDSRRELDNKELVSARLSLFPYMLREPYLRWATATPGKATVKSTSPLWNLADRHLSIHRAQRYAFALAASGDADALPDWPARKLE